jgi:hypothetical protein
MNKPYGVKKPYGGFGDWLAYGVPWALLLILGVVVYVLIERLSDHLNSKDSIDAITGVAVLAIGHGVQHHVHYQRVRDIQTRVEGERTAAQGERVKNPSGKGGSV